MPALRLIPAPTGREFLATLLLFLTWPAHGQPVFSEVNRHELGAMVREIAPVVGEVAGRPFERLPEVVLANEAILAQVVLRERLHLLAAVEGLSPEELAEQARVLASQQLALGFEGKYGFVDERLYVSVERVMHTLMRHRAPPSLLRPVLRVIIAHELAHALQDQHTEMDSLLRRATTDDAVMAMNCTFEGHAVWVQDAVSERLGLEEASALMRGWMGIDASMSTVMGPELFYSHYVYGLGRDFVAHHAAQGGPEAVWEVLGAPPQTTAEIVWPERYPQPGAPVPERVGAALAQAGRHLGRRAWTLREDTVGDYDLREQLLRAGGALSSADGFLRGWSMSSVGAEDDGVQVQVLRFATASEAVRFVEQMQQRAEARGRQAEALPFLDVSVGEIEGVEGDLTVQTSMVFRLDPELEDRQSLRWVVRGSDVVQVLTVNREPGRRRTRRTFRRVFRVLAPR